MAALSTETRKRKRVASVDEEGDAAPKKRAKHEQKVAEKKFLGLYNSRQRILIVGDGNFSFTGALIAGLESQTIIGTAYETVEQWNDLYLDDPGANHDIAMGSGQFGVDATRLEDYDSLREAKFDRVIFNFPHSGVTAGKANVTSNQLLLRGFFRSSKPLLRTASSQIHVTLRDTEFYRNWDVVGQAVAEGMALEASIPFDAATYPGFHHTRTSAAYNAPSIEGAITHVFAVAEEWRGGMAIRQRGTTKSIPESRQAPAPTAADIGAECPICNVWLESTANREGHVAGRRHQAALKQQKLSCAPCQMRFGTEKQLRGHMNSPRHAARVKQLRGKKHTS